MESQASAQWLQREIHLQPRARGIHLITSEIVHHMPELATFRIGLAHIFILHTSASLALNEDADATVRRDMAEWLDRAVPEDAPYFVHTYEGADDMPAHIKAVLTGSELTVPIRDGALALGTWQGIYLCEHRNRGGGRRLLITLQGQV